MLQQTQVATVVPYFERFVAALPTVQALADADEQTVLRLWQGLGYYRRPRHLRQAAQAIVERHGGAIPSKVDELMALPGVGRYTAGAVASIAFGRPAPIVDGNVARVLARLFALNAPLNLPATGRRLWELAAALVPRSAPGDFNQAMMELGATVCTPRQPHCPACPLADLCCARRRGLVDRLPVVAPRPTPRAVEHAIVAVQRGRCFLFVQRPARGLWASMWQLPTCEVGDPQNWLMQNHGIAARKLTLISRFTHQTTHRKITFILHRAQITACPRGGTWRTLTDLDDLPLPKPQQHAVRLLLAEDSAPDR